MDHSSVTSDSPRFSQEINRHNGRPRRQFHASPPSPIQFHPDMILPLFTDDELSDDMV